MIIHVNGDSKLDVHRRAYIESHAQICIQSSGEVLPHLKSLIPIDAADAYLRASEDGNMVTPRNMWCIPKSARKYARSCTRAKFIIASAK